MRYVLLSIVVAMWSGLVGSSQSVRLEAARLDEFNVEFDTNEPLGMQLDSFLRVVGFGELHHAQKDQGPAESSGWLHLGDRLLSVNEAPVTGKNLRDVGLMIQRASLPKVLRFQAPRGENRMETMRQLKSRPGGMDGICGHVEFLQAGIEQLQVPFTLAEFGGRTGCWEAPIVWADPPKACGAPRNPSAIMNAIVVAMRGTCSFSAKAANVEQHAARALIIVNSERSAIVMPLDPTYGKDVALPVVSIGREDGDRLAMAAGGFTPEWRAHMADLDSRAFPAHTRRVASAGGSGAESGPAKTMPGTNGPQSSVRLITDGQFCGTAIAPPNATAIDAAGSAAAFGASAGTANSGSRGTVAPPEAARGLPAGTITLLGGSVGIDGAVRASSVADGAVIAEYRLSEAADGVPLGALRLVAAEPASACVAALRNADEARGAAVLVDRGLCGFGVKLAALRRAGAALLIAVNTEPGLQAIARGADAEAAAIVAQLAAAAGGSPESGRLGPVPAVTVTRSAGQRLRASLAANREDPNNQDGRGVRLRLQGMRDLAELWAELSEMLEHTKWPRAERARRKLFYKLSRRHHPDKPGGAADRFELLSYAFRRAGHRWHPEGSAFVDDYAG